MRRLPAAVLAMVVLAVACGDDGGGAEPTEPARPPTASARTTTTAQGATVDSTLVMSSAAGVEMFSSGGESQQISSRPAAGAYAVGEDLVVFQDAGADGGLFPPSGEGPVKVWSGDEVRDLEPGPEASDVVLLDAAVVDGESVALVAERSGDAPDDTFEALVRIDLDDASRETIVRRPAWESGHGGARLLPDGEVIGLFSSEAHLLLARWSSASEEALWTSELGVDTNPGLTMRNGEITLLESSFDEARDFAPVLTLTTYDSSTGDELTAQSVDIDDPDGEIDTGLFCRDWTSPSALVCGRGGGNPISVSVDDGAFRRLPGAAGALPTAARQP